MTKLETIEAGSFVEPHYIKELGCEGLTSEEIADLVGLTNSKVRGLANELVLDGVLTLPKTTNKGSSYVFSTDDANFLITQTGTKAGIQYCKYLIQQEGKALNYRHMTPEHLRQLAKVKESRDEQNKQLEETSMKIQKLVARLKSM